MIVERPTLERRILSALEAGRIPVVLGGCGAGRTSLLLRLNTLIGAPSSQYVDFAAAATTPERCLRAVRGVDPAAEPPASPRAAFAALLAYFNQPAADSGPVTHLIDEVLDIRTFENFPGLRHVQRDLVAHLAASPSRFVLASRFTARAHRLLRDAPARFEVVHVPPLDAPEVRSLGHALGGSRADWIGDVAPAVATLTDGRAAYSVLLFEALSSMGPAIDPVAALAALLAPHGTLAARCRESYEFRLQRARGYGALKAILGVLAEAEPRNLTEIAHELHRTPGSTKDYLSWLEDVDLITSRGKRYTFEDPLLRLYVRLYGRATPPTDDDIVREVGAFARGRLPASRALAVPLAASAAGAESPGDAGRNSGIIEID